VLSFSVLTKLIRDARKAGVSSSLLKRAETRLGDLAPEIRIYGIIPLCEQCTSLRGYILNKFVIPEATGAADLARQQFAKEAERKRQEEAAILNAGGVRQSRFTKKVMELQEKVHELDEKLHVSEVVHAAEDKIHEIDAKYHVSDKLHEIEHKIEDIEHKIDEKLHISEEVHMIDEKFHLHEQCDKASAKFRRMGRMAKPYIDEARDGVVDRLKNGVENCLASTEKCHGYNPSKYGDRVGVQIHGAGEEVSRARIEEAAAEEAPPKPPLGWKDVLIRVIVAVNKCVQGTPPAARACVESARRGGQICMDIAKA